jgi:O-antigen/teichoic acid export membrane protein
MVNDDATAVHEPASAPTPARAVAARRRRLAIPRSSLLRNSGLMMATTAANLVLGYVFWVIAAHGTSVANVGLASALIAAMSLAVAVGSVGVGNVLIQELPRREAGEPWARVLNAGLALASAVSLVIGVVVLAVLPLVSSDFAILRDNPLVAAGFLAGVLILVIGEMLDRAFVGERSAGRMLMRNTLVAAVKVPLLLAPAFATGGAAGIMAAWIVGSALSLPLAAYLVHGLGRRWRPATTGVREEMRVLRGSVAGHHMVSIGNMAPQFLLQILVAAALSTHDNGIFFTTWRVAGGLFMVSVTIATSLFAEASHEPAKLRRDTMRAAKLIVAILVPCVAILIVFGHQILGILGPEYESGYGLLLIFAVATFPDAATNVYVAVLRVERRLRRAAFLTIGMGILILGLSVPLGLWLGVEGVGVAWLIAQCAGCVVLLADVRSRRRARAAVTA